MTPSEIKELYRIALERTRDPERARVLLEAYLAGQDHLLPVQQKRGTDGND